MGQQTGLALLVDLGGYATAMSGPAMACAIGWALHCPPLVLFSLITVGYSANALGGAGGPLAVLIIAIAAAELGKAVSKETKVDILVTPLVTIFAGVGLSMLIAAPIGAAASQVGTLIMWATEQAPLVMGILVSVIVGVALTLPISSAAICAALGLTGLAGGAAVAGCCAQMVGFAVMSYKENGVGGLVSQGLGTSMLQMGNIIKNPRIWIAPTLASAITGPLATCPLKINRETNYSKDKNLWHLSHEGLDLENPASEPQYNKPGFLELGVSAEQAPDVPTYVTIHFEKGIPTAVDGKEMGAVELVEYLNKLGGANGIGLLDIVENRLVGMKSRGVYETPAAPSCTRPSTCWRPSLWTRRALTSRHSWHRSTPTSSTTASGSPAARGTGCLCRQSGKDRDR